MISGHSNYAMDARAKSAGADHFLNKPFTLTQLRSTVTALASKYRPLTAAEEARSPRQPARRRRRSADHRGAAGAKASPLPSRRKPSRSRRVAAYGREERRIRARTKLSRRAARDRRGVPQTRRRGGVAGTRRLRGVASASECAARTGRRSCGSASRSAIGRSHDDRCSAPGSAASPGSCSATRRLYRLRRPRRRRHLHGDRSAARAAKGGGFDLSRGWGLLLGALSISLDSLGIGFSILYIGVPLAVSLVTSRRSR